MNFLLISALCALSRPAVTIPAPTPLRASVNNLVITEIMADPDPSAGLPSGEYCEIYNAGSQQVNLAGWTLYDGSNRSLPGIVINPGEYVIICDDGDSALFAGYGKCAAVTSISLTNSGEKIALRDAQGIPVDSVTFSDSWYGSSVKKDGGWSLEKVDASFPCPVSSNWQPSKNGSGGTPGSINSVSGTVSDNEAPLLLRSYCNDSVSLVLVFNEPLDPSSALELSNYSIVPANNPIAAVYDDALLQRIRLTLASPIDKGTVATIKVTNISDCSGNIVEQGTGTRFGISENSVYSGLIINEILFNPFDGGADFIEIYHSGSGILDLQQLKVETRDLVTGEIDESENISETPWVIFPGDYLVLTESISAVASQYRSSAPYNFVELNNLPSLNADEGYVAIAGNENTIDALHYSEAFHFELLEDHKGISLEKINPIFPSPSSTSWHSAAAASGFATPGFKNSQYTDLHPGKNLVTLTPEIFSPDNDGTDDVVTLTMRTGTPGYISNLWIYSKDGKIIWDHSKNTLLATSDSFTWDGITNDGVRAPVGIYIVLVEIFDLKGRVEKIKLPFVLAVKQ